MNRNCGLKIANPESIVKAEFAAKFGVLAFCNKMLQNMPLAFQGMLHPLLYSIKPKPRKL
jgi:hypothetical protein